MILSECRPVRNVKEFAVKYMCSKVKTPCGGAENASTGKRKYGKRKYESAGMENASTESASTMQTFSQIKKVWYFTFFSVGAFLSGVGKWITDCFFLRYRK